MNHIKSNDKTILSIWNTGGKGKSSTLREFAKLLIAAYPTHIPIFPIPLVIHTVNDFRIVVEINRIIIGIETQGDPKTGLQRRLLELADGFNCDVILCTTRTRGETVRAVEFVANSRGYQTIWTSTYQIGNRASQSLVNELKAKHILDLLQTLSIII